MPVTAEMAWADIPTLGAGLRSGQFTAVELCEFFLERLERLGPKLNAVVTITAKTALAEARQADRELAAGKDLGPLHGIPWGAKDLLATSGIPTSWGAAPYRGQLPEGEATVVTRLRQAGAVLVAKLAMVEIAGGMGYRQADASFTGPGLNPWDTGRWSGGSSSGPGSAVGGGLVPFAIGSETWGSIMTPAGFCGVTGLRPTYGRISRHGAMALSWTMDKLGPMCRTAHDCGLVLAAIAGHDPADATSVELSYRYPAEETARRPWKLALLKDGDTSVQPEVQQNFRAAVEVLKESGTFETIDLPDLPYGTVAATFISCEMAAAFEGLVTSGDCWELTAPEDRWGAHAAQMIPAKDYLNAMRIRPLIQRAMDDVLSKYDAIITPTLATVAYPNNRSFREYRRGYTSTDIGGAGNGAGIPAITVPNGFGEGHLPTGIQFVGRAFEENRLLAIAAEYQRKTAWHTEHPDL
ncbi:MAG: amidase [Planctomycetaceae bacterium]|nr:amidase [Planctomycetaceae bacterium]